jgi:hypothetical protein
MRFLLREQRRERVRAREQVLAGLAKGGRGQVLALRVAEDVGEEHVRVLAIRLEQNEVRVRILAAVLLHADLHARMDDRAERLREDHRQAALVQLLDRDPPVLVGAARVEGNQRVDAEEQVHTLVERHRRVKRLVERPVDVVRAADLDGRDQAGQRGRSLDRLEMGTWS